MKLAPHHRQDPLQKKLAEQNRLRQHGHLESRLVGKVQQVEGVRKVEVPEEVNVAGKSRLPCALQSPQRSP